MKKIILFGLAILSLSIVIVSCQKSSPPSAGAVEQNVYPLNFITIENATDSGTLAPSKISKSGYTAIIQRNYSKDSSAVDSIKLRYEDVTKLFPGTTPNPTYNSLVDSLILPAPAPAAVETISAYPGLVTQYYTFSIDSDSTFVTGKTYTVIATVYTSNGSSATTTYASLFKW
jgi:hypothetical protein